MDGADYVDLKVNLNVNNLNDKITMFVPMEYLTEEARAAAEEQIKEEQTAPPPSGIEIDEEGNEQIVPPITEEELKDLLEACYV